MTFHDPGYPCSLDTYSWWAFFSKLCGYFSSVCVLEKERERERQRERERERKEGHQDYRYLGTTFFALHTRVELGQHCFILTCGSCLATFGTANPRTNFFLYEWNLTEVRDLGLTWLYMNWKFKIFVAWLNTNNIYARLRLVGCCHFSIYIRMCALWENLLVTPSVVNLSPLSYLGWLL